MVKIEGLEKLNRQLARIPQEARAEIKKALTKAGEEMADMARTLAPLDEGDLRASIKSEPGKHELAVEVSAGDHEGPHARLVEYGTENMAARPYFWPAYRATKKRRRGQITRAVNAAAKKVAGQ